MNSQDLCLKSSNLEVDGISNTYHGKVRDVYTVGELLVMVASDRISAFDHVLTKAIPYKGQVLNQIASYFLKATKNIVPNWLIDTPDPNVSVGKACVPFKVEMVIRGYLAGHAWRTYSSGGRVLCGVTLPHGLKQNDALPYPIITPTTKASEGHDEDISKEEIISQGLVSANDWEILEKYTHALFDKGQKMAKERGLILVDTKYEFGKIGEDIYLMDEIHTPDSSRYFILDGYQERQDLSLPQKSLSKEFVREWLMDHGFQGKEGQIIPTMPEDFVLEISNRYIELYELITGLEFEKADVKEISERVNKNVKAFFEKNSF